MGMPTEAPKVIYLLKDTITPAWIRETQVESEGLGVVVSRRDDSHGRKNKIQKGKYEGMRRNWDHKRNMVYGLAE